MAEKIKKHQRTILIVLIAICMGIILIGGFRYMEVLSDNLQNNAIQNVRNVTIQQQQAFDNFIALDRERLHSFADYFAHGEHSSAEEVQQQLTMFDEVDATYSVMCLDDGWFCSNASEDIRQVDDEKLDFYRGFTGSGIRSTYTALFSGNPKFGYYEAFTFPNGHKGLLQKSYDRTKVSEAFSLSFYDGQGLAYVVNERGDILLRPTGLIGDHLYENIFDVLTGTHAEEQDIDRFIAALRKEMTGSMTLTGDMGKFVYTYVPIENGDNWYLVSVVPEDAITAETNQMMQNTKTTLWLLILILVICAVFVSLIRRTNKDITAKEQEVEYQARLFDAFMAYLSNNTDDMYMMLDQEKNEVEYVSPNVERVLGIASNNVVETMIRSDMERDPETTKAHLEKINALAPGQAIEPRSVERINLKTGEHKFFQENIFCTVVQDRRKRMVYISDRTKEMKTRESLEEALRMARAANDAKSAFLSSVSHDIRTPMNAIIGFLALMRDEADNPAVVREYTQRIDAASHHLLGLINDVLDMNKIESGGTTLSISEMDLPEVIEEINTIIRPQAKAKEQTFEIFVSHLTHENLLGDKLRINQILINLLSNAVKYTPKEGTIQMRVDELPQAVDKYSRIRFTVSDNGLGMSEDYVKVIFDPFTREETKITHEIQGTGLGMAITKGLVDLMGGTIRVESEPDKGSTFTVELELRIQDKEEQDTQFWSDHGVARVIVVDDQEDVCQNIVKTMSKTGVAMDYSTDGGTALQMVFAAQKEGHPYDLVLLDWMMPDLNGLETARLIRKEYSDRIPILLLTAYDWSDIEHEAEEIGVDHFMPKPFFISTFKDAIRRVKGSMETTTKEEQSDVVQGKHILIADDIEVNRIIIVKILESLGAVCDTAENGQEAVEKFEASQPGEYDLIFMDVQMPIMDGYTATRAIRSSEHPSAATVPIIAMTANAFVDDVREAIESGMDAHIAKPVQIDNLKSTVQKVLDDRAEQMKS